MSVEVPAEAMAEELKKVLHDVPEALMTQEASVDALLRSRAIVSEKVDFKVLSGEQHLVADQLQELLNTGWSFHSPLVAIGQGCSVISGQAVDSYPYIFAVMQRAKVDAE